jgi:hypothetical protein
MPLEGHWERQTTTLRQLTQRERWVAISAVGVTFIAIAALVLATVGDSQPKPAPGCIRAQIAHVMGSEQLNLCGGHAKRACAAHAGDPDPVALSIQAACREAGLL